VQSIKTKTSVVLTLTAILTLFTFATAKQDQQEPDPANIEKAKAAINSAIQARGSSAYMNVKTELGTGQFSQFEKGMATLPIQFSDYIEYPDKERTEFGKGKSLQLQANTGSTGWTFDNASKAIKDQPEEKTREFVEGLRYSMDGILRGSWRDPKVKLTYFPRREAWRLKFGEAVRLEYPDGNVVTLYLDFDTHLPILLQREHTIRDAPAKEETRYAQWVERQGIKAPNIIDSFLDGVQTGRVNYDNVVYNQAFSANLFTKPANPKQIK
jgi:hypothetical protein